MPNPAGGLASDLGITYRSGVIEAEAARRRRWRHLPATPVVELHGQQLSTLDLFDGGSPCWSVGSTGRHSAVAQAGAGALAMLVAGRELTGQTGELCCSYRLGASGAVLVRPDGYVAWRCEAMPADPVGALAEPQRPQPPRDHRRLLSAQPDEDFIEHVRLAVLVGRHP